MSTKPQIGEIRNLPIKTALHQEGIALDEPIDIVDIVDMFWGDNLRIHTAPHRWTGEKWERQA